MANTLSGKILALALAVATALPVSAAPTAASLFGAEKRASRQAPAPIGTYARGCGAGMVQLPETGPTWQAMRLSRNRNWGQPEMIAFIQRLGGHAAAIGWKGIYVGDISQPRGGPMTSGHASHQIGLDADIWMLPPRRLTLTRAERESISSISVRSADQRRVNGNYTAAHAALLRAAAMDPAVDRIFVTAPVKIEMCKHATRADRAWLQKIRPLYGHDTHFHVRLKCPPGARSCETQRPTVAELSKGGDGCDETLTWWVTDYLDPPKKAARPAQPAKPQPRKRGAREFTMTDLPRECRAVLASD
ncbi:penicillin-insensitive murein endopeptidase [Rhodovulum sp. BSW8]|uniref:Murein endopeptidase n=1 Tax=Rhodovulum visakhapatnamense TaxID=364297 RepID=A0A4V3GU06_9RHOB|nr:MULTISPECIES: penicillin-insensitive murein endopeptidase [Rhodovulum]OLS42938.1 penicillin-insensitive murein endopeptidase [Rhodovulum sulfidophilum]MBL3569528.1 penicillin-insensitive murein endopeptidase [Rhodovulum visakhapatnamense]MBL3578246.1 penicillin-insensitive murein endopeptidase [Rhodovulum visakhapatnamense]RBO53696.1 penicillin-insensitive murein endopeptidase [Rhodovulum sp. BSW8]TDX28904.1 murein endopeptidase [Rhodovulum visakhapatnamense]